jgi:pyridoxine 5-phosphate synthase
MKYLRLGVNIDHVATIRNARGGSHPDPVRAAHLSLQAGADGITAHLREDRRHISDDDIVRLKRETNAPLNLEMAATAEMLDIALRHRPSAVCLVPERRAERTTEGGLDVIAGRKHLSAVVGALRNADLRVTLFIEPTRDQVAASRDVGAYAIEFHTGRYCLLDGNDRATELARIVDAAEYACSLGLECHAGHGLNYDNVGQIAAIPYIEELNIGHFLIGEAIFCGLTESVTRMRKIMLSSRGHREVSTGYENR